jgi:hypothetical protein
MIYRRFGTQKVVWLVCLLITVIGCQVVLPGAATPEPTATLELPATTTPEPTDTLAPSETPTVQCPVGTPESPPMVDPVTSPTDLLVQEVIVNANPKALQMIVTCESGTFSADRGADGAFHVMVTLLPNTTHNLVVSGVWTRNESPPGSGCFYGGASSAHRDKNYNPLVIVQGKP